MADDKKYERYLDERGLLLGGRNDASRSFEKTIITMSAGALGLSITFLNVIAPDPRCLGWLVASWIAFFLSLLLMLVSFMLSIYAFDKEITASGDKYEGKQDERPICLNLFIQAMYWISLVAFMIGAAFLAVFAKVNL